MKKFITLIALLVTGGLFSQVQTDTLVVIEDKWHEELVSLTFQETQGNSELLATKMDSIYQSDTVKYNQLYVNFRLPSGLQYEKLYTRVKEED